MAPEKNKEEKQAEKRIDRILRTAREKSEKAGERESEGDAPEDPDTESGNSAAEDELTEKAFSSETDASEEETGEDEIPEFFAEELLRMEKRKKELQKKYDRIAWLRLAVFLAAVVLIYMGVTDRKGKEIFLAAGIAMVIGFLVLIRLHDGVEKEQRLLKARETVVKAYPARFSDGWRDFSENGEEYLSKKDTVERDLDLLGPGSLYQLISISHSAYGKWLLADSIHDPSTRIKERKERQEAIRELSEKKEFLIDYESAVRQAFVDERKHPTRETVTSKPGNAYKPGKIRFTSWMWLMMFLVPAGNAAVIVLILAGVLQPAWILVSFLAGYGITAGCKAKLNDETGGIFSSEMTKGEVYPIFRTIRNESFSAPLLCSIHERVAGNDGMMAAQRRLSRLADLKNLDYNPLLGMLLTGFAGWDFFLTFLAWRWDHRHGAAFAGSFEIIGELEELGSLAVLSVVRETSIPTLNEEEKGVRFTGLFHPLLNPKKVVANSGELCSPLTVITGSNMSGKTTFLRTVAINLVLSYLGAGAAAESFISGHRRIFTSMRVQDDVIGGISTFYAEILRVREMADYIRKKKDVPALCLIDEIFKGTNSADRILGAEEALRKLSVNGSMVVVTTHDFELCSLKQADGNPAENYHFEEYYEANKLKFDYTIKDGPCTTRNAQAILRMAGLMGES